MPKIKCTASVLKNFNGGGGEKKKKKRILTEKVRYDDSAVYHTEVRQEDCLELENNLEYIDLICLCPCPPPHTQKRTVIVEKKLLRFSWFFFLSVCLL